MGEPIKGGKSKQYQLENWKRYFDFNQVGQKIVINTIYDTPIPKPEDQRIKGNKSIYVPYIELLILNKLAQEKQYSYTLTKNKWLLYLGMINNNYMSKSYSEIIQKNPHIKKFDINQFYLRVNQKLKKILFDSLRNLKNRCVIDYYEEIVVVEYQYSFENNAQRQIHRLASDQERKDILAAKKQILNDMGFDKITQVFIRFKAEEYYAKLNNYLFEHHGWLYAYSQYKIIYNKKDILSEIPKIELQLQRLELNSKVIDAVNQQAEHNYEKNQKDVQEKQNELLQAFLNEDHWGEHSTVGNGINIFCYRDKYVDIQKQLAEELLRLE